jgi:hypothetical protein
MSSPLLIAVDIVLQSQAAAEGVKKMLNVMEPTKATAKGDLRVSWPILIS